MIGHGANEKGHDGIQLWITKTRPLHKDGPLITKSNLAIVDSSPSMLIVKLTTSTWRCLLVAGRAPHSGRGEHEVALFWKQVSTRVRQYERDFPILFLDDTNGHLGQFSSEAVGSLAPATENLAGHYFHDWMLEHRLFRRLHSVNIMKDLSIIPSSHQTVTIQLASITSPSLRV